MATYRLRLSVEATQFRERVLPWPPGVFLVTPGMIITSKYGVKTREGPVPIEDTDWVIENPTSKDLSVLSNDDFLATYEVPQ